MDNATASMLGSLVGGILGLFLMQALWEFALFKRICDDPVKGKLYSTAAAYVTAVTLWGFGAADGGSWKPGGLLVYLPGLLVIGTLAYRRGMKLREQIDPDADVFR